MKRILHIGMSSEIGGIESFVMNLYRKIDKNRFQFDFLTTSKIAYEEEILSLGGKIYRISSRREGYFKHQKELKKFFQKHHDFTCIHQHVINSSYISPLAFAPKHIKKIVHSHRAGKETNLRIALFNEINRSKLVKYSNLTLACSTEAGKYIFKNNKFIVVPNSIDLSEYQYNPNTREIIRENLSLKNKFVLGHVGRLSRVKNHKLLIDIFAALNKEIANTILILVGDGELRSELEMYAKEKSLEECIVFLGAKKNVAEILQAMDLFVFPSIYEGLGTAVIEAQATGLKCYVSNKVPQEVNVTGNCEFFSIDEAPEIVAQKIAEDIKIGVVVDKLLAAQKINDSGYDIEYLTNLFESNYYK